MGILVNKISHVGKPTEKDILESEIRFERKRGNWKRANDLQRHLDRMRKL
jgi:hypothetical protein